VPPGCAFHPRCAYCPRNGDLSTTVVPLMREAGPGHTVACHLEPEDRRQIWVEEVQPRL
jgi:peptide/nickel transport system ATP-binding protein